MRLGIRTDQSVVEKAQRDISKLTKKVITNKRGKKQTVYVKQGEMEAGKKGKAPDLQNTRGKKVDVPKKLGIQKPDKGTVKVKRGDNASGVDVNGHEVSGIVTAVGVDGITIDHEFHVENGKFKSKSGEKGAANKPTPAQRQLGLKLLQSKKVIKPDDDYKGYSIKYKDHGNYITAEAYNSSGELEFAERAGSKMLASTWIRRKIDDDGKKDQDKKKQEVPEKPKDTFIPPDKFNSTDWSKQFADPKATPDEAGVEYILKSFGKEGAEIAKHIRETNAKLKFGADDRDTQKKFLLSGKGESARYNEDREKLHGAIMQTLLAPDKIRMARPVPGEAPTFMILGGRGGSGKSWFKDKMYDPSKYVILDADEIKGMLPEFRGWNAQDVHEESSDILEQMFSTCIREGLNIVLDGTMKTAKSALAKILRVQSAGYRTEAHYMHLPAHEAAKRAIGRFMTENKDFSGRYVPVNRVLENTTNEDSFDQVQRVVDKWSFRDNNVKRGQQPILISEGEKEVKKSFSALVKKLVQAYN
ncbi:MAG: zeta toxin family protein [Treponema sp.]|jgi:predicted ABC-type ATPase|nr:zeta toxin family protein [Treponema sp.]